MEGEEPAFQSFRLCVCCSRFDSAFRQPCEVGAVGQVEGEGIGGGEGVLFEFQAEARQFRADFPESLPCFPFEVGASFDERAESVIEQGGLFGGEGQCGALLV